MVQQTLAKTPFRFVADACLGLGVYFGLSAATLGPSAAAGLLGIAASPTPSEPMIGVPLLAHAIPAAGVFSEPNLGFVMMAGVFSALFALNFAFIRHLRKAHIAAHKIGPTRPTDETVLPYQ